MSDVVAGSVKAYFLASRPQTLAAAFVPVMLGAALASRSGAVRFASVLAALVGACAIQVATNYANDAFDFERGADDSERLGPKRAAQSGWLTPAQLKRAMVASFAVAVLAGLWLVYASGPILLAIGLASIAAGYAYTGGPYPLAYHGLGDAFVIVFFGFVAVLGTVFVAGATPSASDAVAGLAVGALADCILVVNNLRDREGDARVGKRTVIVRFGATFGRWLYLSLVLVALGAAFAMWTAFSMGPWVMLSWLVLPLAVRLVRSVFREEGAALNPRLAGTAKLLVLFGLLLSLGVAVGRVP